MYGELLWIGTGRQQKGSGQLMMVVQGRQAQEVTGPARHECQSIELGPIRKSITISRVFCAVRVYFFSSGDSNPYQMFQPPGCRRKRLGERARWAVSANQLPHRAASNLDYNGYHIG